MRASFFTFATDLRDEGVETVLDNLQGRAGVDGLTLAVAYHDARDVFPHRSAACVSSSRVACSSVPTTPATAGCDCNPSSASWWKTGARWPRRRWRRAAGTCA